MTRARLKRVAARLLASACLLSVAVLTLGGCRPTPPKLDNRSWPVMGTLATLTVPAEPRELAGNAERGTRATFARLEAELSIFNPDSDIARLNAAGGAGPVAIGGAAHEVLTLALAHAERSGGCFDPTVGPLMAAWGFRGGRTPERLPAEADVSAARARTGYRQVTLGAADASLPAGFRVDLGGIAKGYAVDRVYDELTRMALPRFMINLGGNIRVHGQARPERPWTIGVRNPFAREALLGVLRLPDGMAVATSGNYERFVTLEGRRYSHVMDPRSGRPVEGMAGVTVVAPTATEADAWSTALFVAGIEEGLRLLRTAEGVLALFIPDEQPIRIVLSPGLRLGFTPEPEFADAVRDGG